MKQSTLFLLAGAGLAIWYFSKAKPSRQGQVDYLVNWGNSQPGDTQAMKDYFSNIVTGQMTDQEIAAVYEFIHDYWENGRKPVPAGSDLSRQMIAISSKYNIFT